MKIIDVKNVRVNYRGVEALSDISFGVEAGDYVAIVGPNGSGKTTLIKAILGLIPAGGTISFHGKRFSEYIHHNHIGYLPQKIAYIDQTFPATAEEIVLSGVYCCKSFPKRLNKEDYRAAKTIMDLLGITALKDRPIGALSGGQQQRILLARALMHFPDILILDEPTMALDPQSRDIFYSTIGKLNREKKVTVLLVSHDLGSVGEYATRLLYLDRTIIFYGTGDEFCKSAKMTDYFGAHSQHLICHRHQ